MGATQNGRFASAVDSLPETLQDNVARWFERLEAEHEDCGLDGEYAETLARLVACSDFAAATVLREWQWFANSLDDIDDVPDADALERLVADVRQNIDDADEAKRRLRRFRHRFMVRILWREVRGVATLDETLGSLSLLADRMLDAAAGFAGRQVQERYGVVRDERGQPVSIVILGMGKLGGTELNFSSDVDLIFLFPSGTDSDGKRCLSAQEYFTRLTRHIVALLDEVTADGFAFRVDTRLRPFGDSGPPVAGFAALESYLVQHGRGWERYAYVKARIVGPRPPRAVVDELQNNLISPFVYRRYLDFGVFESLREMRELIAAEVQRREMAGNIKLGPGGIREIEFIVQSLQLVRGGSRPELQERGMLRVLPRLVGPHGLTQVEADELRGAYEYLRRLENFIQAMRDQQTHDLPADEADRARLALAMRRPDWDSLIAQLGTHRGHVTRQFEAMTFPSGTRVGNRLKQRLAALWESEADADTWTTLLEAEEFMLARDIAERLVVFAASPAARRIDATARRRLQKFIPELLLLLQDREQPATAMDRVLAVVGEVLRRSAYLALLNENPNVLARLVSLCERSLTISQQVSRFPVLLDELLDPRVYNARISKDGLEAELEERLRNSGAEDSEERMAVLGQFQRANLFRVAVADFSGNLPIMKVSDSLTYLAECVLGHALAIAWQDTVQQYGEPEYFFDGERHKAGFGIVAYGKLGGLELSYGSDLDIVFLHDSRGSEQQTSGARSLDNTVFFTRLVRRLVHFLTTQTGSGRLYEVDMRLRPDGSSGLLVSSVEAFERYQEDNAWTWEHQALLRARPVAGRSEIRKQFERIRSETLRGRVRRDDLRADVRTMRERMRDKLDKSDARRFDLKQGSGGIADIEFIVQYLVLANAGEHPSVFHFSDNIRQLEALAATQRINEETSARLQETYKSYRLRSHHLVLDEHKPLVASDEFAAEREYVQAFWKETFGDNTA